MTHETTTNNLFDELHGDIEEVRNESLKPSVRRDDPDRVNLIREVTNRAHPWPHEVIHAMNLSDTPGTELIPELEVRRANRRSAAVLCWTVQYAQQTLHLANGAARGRASGELPRGRGGNAMNPRNILEDAREEFAQAHGLNRNAGAVVMTHGQLNELTLFARDKLVGMSVPTRKRDLDIFVDRHGRGAVAVLKIAPSRAALEGSAS